MPTEIHSIDCPCRECRRLITPIGRPRGFLRTWAVLIAACLAAWAGLIAGACRALSSFTTR